MADSCIISKDQLSQKEQALKNKLYGGGGSNNAGVIITGKKISQASNPAVMITKSNQASPEKVAMQHRTQL